MVQVVSFTHFVYLCVCILETVVTTKSLRIQMDKELVIIMNMTFKNTTHSELSNHRPNKRVKGTVLTLIVPSLVMDYIAHLRRGTRLDIDINVLIVVYRLICHVVVSLLMKTK